MDRFKNIIKNKVPFEGFQSNNDQAIWAILEAQIDELEGRKRKRKWLYTYAAAASVVLGIMIALLIRPSNEKPLMVERQNNDSPKTVTGSRPSTSSHDSQKEAPIPEKQTEKIAQKPIQNIDKQIFTKSNTDESFNAKLPEYFELPDQSVVALDKDAHLFYNESYLDRREVLLEGRGYFEVAHDTEHPFKVYFGNTHLVVLGTKFYIKALPTDAAYIVAVVEGRVKVYNPYDKQYTVLTKGQELVLTPNVKSVLSSQIAETTTLWKKGTLIFDKARLKKVFYALNKAHNGNIKYDAKISECIFTGNLSGMSLSEALNLIKMTTNLVSEENNDHIFVTGTKCD